MYSYANPFGSGLGVCATVLRVIVSTGKMRDMVGLKVCFLQEEQMDTLLMHIINNLGMFLGNNPRMLKVKAFNCSINMVAFRGLRR